MGDAVRKALYRAVGGYFFFLRPFRIAAASRMPRSVPVASAIRKRVSMVGRRSRFSTRMTIVWLRPARVATSLSESFCRSRSFRINSIKQAIVASRSAAFDTNAFYAKKGLTAHVTIGTTDDVLPMSETTSIVQSLYTPLKEATAELPCHRVDEALRLPVTEFQRLHSPKHACIRRLSGLFGGCLSHAELNRQRQSAFLLNRLHSGLCGQLAEGVLRYFYFIRGFLKPLVKFRLKPQRKRVFGVCHRKTMSRQILIDKMCDYHYICANEPTEQSQHEDTSHVT